MRISCRYIKKFKHFSFKILHNMKLHHSSSSISYYENIIFLHSVFGSNVNFERCFIRIQSKIKRSTTGGHFHNIKCFFHFVPLAFELSKIQTFHNFDFNYRILHKHQTPPTSFGSNVFIESFFGHLPRL